MSVAEAKRFATDFQSDSALKSKLMAMPGDTPEQRLSAINSAGYSITMGDLEGNGPMEDEALEGVAGGGMVTNWFKGAASTVKKGWNSFW